MQKDRLSFSRSSSYKKEHKTAEIRPSLDEENVFGDKHIHFSKTVAYHPSEDECYVALESYDDVLVRVCGFAAHDQRKTATKIEEFLERSLAFAHRQRTKHGSIVNLSNEEVRMWRRLAKHDWTSEAITTTSEPPPVSKGSSDDEPCRASCSSATVDCADDSDADEQAPEEEEDLYVPEDVCLDELVEVINYCVNFGEELFSLSEVQKLVRSELLVEEDGWI
ncbi:TPA: hypothetical protein N0F65_007634 [Lagenidium giganteum]|uniref:Uncharacterized protein n=1 Tax=Lagenidium giganteum TaxID=4803 RepID=A0AAV2Z9M5_9STRA|nr:TPA: hypothetical protein N0F65_007634 [Lagenidium giganteum]